MMQIARSMGVMESDLKSLLAGRAPLSVARRVGTLQSNVQAFIDGQATLGMARSFGVMQSSLQEMRNFTTREGAIGMLIGLCISPKS